MLLFAKMIPLKIFDTAPNYGQTLYGCMQMNNKSNHLQNVLIETIIYNHKHSLHKVGKQHH